MLGNTGKQYTKWYRTEDGKNKERELQNIKDEDRKYGYGAHLHVQFMKTENLADVYNEIDKLHNTNIWSFNPIDYSIKWAG
jgi:hypothetical protein